MEFEITKVDCINCQTIVHKVQEFQCLIDREKPEVVVGTESWLCSDISDSEVFPSGYMAYRSYRKSRDGGGFVLVRNSLIYTEQSEFQTNCEILWIKQEIVGEQPLLIGA